MLKLVSKILMFCIPVALSCASLQGVVNNDVVADILHSRVILKEPRLKTFRSKGPFAVSERRGRELTIDLNNTIVVDHFYAETTDKIPVVFITHGNYSSRDAHYSQARYLASWGFHVLVSDLPNRNQWLDNGSRLKITDCP